MATGPKAITLGAAAIRHQSFAARYHTIAADYWALTKPDINFLIAIATFAGFYLACLSQLHDFQLMLLIRTLLGTLLVAGGTGTLNQYVERRFDAQMRRTRRRPLAAGRLDPSSALRFGILLFVAGGNFSQISIVVTHHLQVKYFRFNRDRFRNEKFVE